LPSLRGGGQGSNEIGDLVGHPGVAAVLGNALYNCAANDHAIGKAGNLAGLIGVRNTKAHDDGHGGRLPDCLDTLAQALGDAGLLASDPFARDVIDESAGPLGDPRRESWAR